MSIRTVEVNCPDGVVIKLDNVPFDTTTSVLLAKISSIVSVPSNNFECELQTNNKPLQLDEIVEYDTINVVFTPKKQSIFMSAFFSLLFFAGFAVTGLCAVSKNIGTSIYVFICFSLILGILSLVLKPSGQIVRPGSLDFKEKPVLDFLWLFVRSFWWKFRLEDILINQ